MQQAANCLNSQNPKTLSLNDEEIEKLLRDWGRWASQRHTKQGHVYSIEHKWSSPQCWEAPQPRPPALDLLMCQRVEDAWRVMSHATYKQLLKLHYVRKLDPRWSCRRIRIKFSEYHNTLLLARNWIAVELC